MTGHQPIDCADHDGLEPLATLRQTARISYRADDGSTRQTEDLIVELYARDGVEYRRAGGVRSRGRRKRLGQYLATAPL